jgi:hypothetical protein
VTYGRTDESACPAILESKTPFERRSGYFAALLRDVAHLVTMMRFKVYPDARQLWPAIQMRGRSDIQVHR